MREKIEILVKILLIAFILLIVGCSLFTEHITDCEKKAIYYRDLVEVTTRENEALRMAIDECLNRGGSLRKECLYSALISRGLFFSDGPLCKESDTR